MSIDFAPQQWEENKPRITVIGVGGAGGNAVNNMINGGLEGVEFGVANTDSQSLQQSLSEQKVQLGVNVTHGLGAGARPDIGRVAAEEALQDIQQYLEANNMVFIAAGMGGGTGTGAAPVIARAAREQGILTVGVVTKPFQFEGIQRMRLAEAGLGELQQYVDTLIVIPNQNLFRIANEQTTFASAFNLADEVLHAGVRGVTDLMVSPGLINLDFADIRTVMGEMGKAMMGTGEASGESRATEAAEAAINNPLLDNASIEGARGVLINITGGSDVTLMEVDEAATRICKEVDEDANIIFGTSMSDELEGQMRVAVIATGIDADSIEEPIPEPSDKVHVLGLNSRRGAGASSATGSSQSEIQQSINSESDKIDDIDKKLENSLFSDEETSLVYGQDTEGALTGNEEHRSSGMNIESENKPLEEKLPPVAKTISANTAGAIKAGVVLQKNIIQRDAAENDTPENSATQKQYPKDSFIPAPAVKPGESSGKDVDDMADPFSVASVENAGSSSKKRGPSLFERMTGSGRSRKESRSGTTQKVKPTQPPALANNVSATKQNDDEPTFENVSSPERQADEILTREEDPLEIPAFLRRQAN